MDSYSFSDCDFNGNDSDLVSDIFLLIYEIYSEGLMSIGSEVEILLDEMDKSLVFLKVSILVNGSELVLFVSDRSDEFWDEMVIDVV